MLSFILLRMNVKRTVRCCIACNNIQVRFMAVFRDSQPALKNHTFTRDFQYRQSISEHPIHDTEMNHASFSVLPFTENNDSLLANYSQLNPSIKK